MRRLIGVLLCCMPALLCQAGGTATGRWEGVVRIPGHPFAVVVDLAQSGQLGWTGSVTAPGLNIKGTPLADIVVKDSEATFAIKDAFGGADVGPATLKAQIDAHGGMAGDFIQAGNTAAFALNRTGPPQVELPARSTSVEKAIEGQWVGAFQPDDYPRHVTITLKNHPGGPATAEFFIVGKKTTNVPVDLVAQEGDFLRIESIAFGIVFEGPFLKKAGEIKGSLSLNSTELPLDLHRPH